MPVDSSRLLGYHLAGSIEWPLYIPELMG